MEAARLNPTAWYRLSKAERVDLIAYQKLKRQRRQELLLEAIDKVPGEFGLLAQAIIGALD
jgi:hypothetical protein